jgi:exosortase
MIMSNIMHMFNMLWLSVILLYAPVFKTLYGMRWEKIDYTHAYYILPVSLWLVWRERAKLACIAGSPRTTSQYSISTWVCLPLLLLGLAMFVFGWRQEYLFISTLSLIPVLFGLTGYIYNPAVSLALSFPILYLLLLVPPPFGVLDSLTLPMRQYISAATFQLLHVTGYPITRDGLLLSINGHDIYMGAPCSGFRSLITMISLGLVYVYISKASMKKKAIILSSIVPLALLGNFGRVLGMCLVTFYMGEKAGHKYHDISGFVIFLVLIAGMLGIEWLLERKASPLGAGKKGLPCQRTHA